MRALVRHLAHLPRPHPARPLPPRQPKVIANPAAPVCAASKTHERQLPKILPTETIPVMESPTTPDQPATPTAAKPEAKHPAENATTPQLDALRQMLHNGSL